MLYIRFLYTLLNRLLVNFVTPNIISNCQKHLKTRRLFKTSKKKKTYLKGSRFVKRVALSERIVFPLSYSRNLSEIKHQRVCSLGWLAAKFFYRFKNTSVFFKKGKWGKVGEFM